MSGPRNPGSDTEPVDGQRAVDDGGLELGVLLVHGIGNQVQGETLSAWGEALLEWLELWENPDRMVHRRHRPIDAHLRPGSDSPASIKLIRPDNPDYADNAPRTWLLTEAWWAEAFAPSTARQIAQWALQAFPLVLVGHGVGRFRLVGRAYRMDNQSWRQRLAGWIRLLFWAVLAIPAVVIIGPALGLLVVLMLILSLVPIVWVRRAVNTLQNWLTSFLGDSHIFLQSPFQAAAMAQSVIDGLELLEKQNSRRIAIVAHSQGAAVTKWALDSRDQSKGKVDLLITVGSGLNKLQQLKESTVPLLIPQSILTLVMVAGINLWYELSQGLPTGGDIVQSVAPLAAGCALALMIGGLLGARNATLPAWIIVVATILLFAGGLYWTLVVGVPRPGLFVSFLAGMALVMVGLVFVEMSAEYEALPRDTLRSKVDDWCDLWASKDPIPNGPTRVMSGTIHSTFEDDWPRSIPVRNLDSSISDHSSYWGARDAALTHIGLALLDLSDDPIGEHSYLVKRRIHLELMADMLPVAHQDRAWRLYWLRNMRRLAVLVPLAIGALAWPWAPTTADTAEVAPDWLQPDLIGPVARWLDSARGGFMLVVAASWIVCYISLTGAWRYWNSEAELNYLDRRDRWSAIRPSLVVLYLVSLSVVIVIRLWIWVPDVEPTVLGFGQALLEIAALSFSAMILLGMIVSRTIDRLYRFATGGPIVNKSWLLVDLRKREREEYARRTRSQSTEEQGSPSVPSQGSDRP